MAPLWERSGRPALDRIILGLYDGPSGGAALVREGKLLAIAEEDRISRQSQVSGLPRASTQTVIRVTGVPPEDIKAVLVATRNATYAEGVGGEARGPLLYRMSEALPAPKSWSERIRESFASARRRRIDESLRSEFGVSCPVLFVDHHLAHAVAATYAAGLSDALTVTMDGGADGVWAAVTRFDEGTATRVAYESQGGSIVGFLAAVCDRLGIPDGLDRTRRLEDLAARGVAAHYEQLAPTVQWTEGHLELDPELFRPGGVLARIRTSARKEDVAASAVQLASEATRRWVVHHIDPTDSRPLVLGGDLFEMPSLVKAVEDAPEVRTVRLAIAPGDVALPVGAGLAGCLPDFLPNPMPRPREPLGSPFLGVAFSEEEIEQALNDEHLDYRLQPEIERDLARVLAEGRTVVRFDGQTEVGNRGLGNRVVLRSPQGPLRRGRIGFVFPPGAYHVMVREELFHRCFRTDGLDPGDLLHQPGLVTPIDDFPQRFPELIGWGGWIRVQTVSAQASPRLHSILEEFESWTGHPVLAAAPFRLPNEPLVSSPLDAIRTFRKLGADFAAFGRFLVRSGHESGIAAPEPSDSEERVGP